MSANDTPPNPATTPSASPFPDSICGYPIIAGLASSQANESDFLGPGFQAKGPGGRSVVLKPLDRDCLLPSGLHPSIKERLSRVRELALGSVANLYGVERESRDPAKNGAASNQAWLIWEYVRGQTLEAFAADPTCTERRLAVVA